MVASGTDITILSVVKGGEDISADWVMTKLPNLAGKELAGALRAHL